MPLLLVWGMTSWACRVGARDAVRLRPTIKVLFQTIKHALDLVFLSRCVSMLQDSFVKQSKKMLGCSITNTTQHFHMLCVSY